MPGTRAPSAAPAVRPLRDYQARGVSEVTAKLAAQRQGQLLMACGTGKTRVAAEVAARLTGPGEVTVVLVPSITLAAQVIAAWPEGCPVGDVLAVCSDATVGERDGMRASALPVPVTTDPGEIARWLKGTSSRALLTGTYDSAHRLAEGLRTAGVTAALTVFDEAHRLAGPEAKVSARVLGPGVLPDRYRLFCTATPRIGSGPQAVSMDNPELFGDPLYTYSFAQAIDDGWLKKPRVVVAAVTSNQVAEMLGADAGQVVTEGGLPLRLAVAQAALVMCAREYGLRRCLVFTSRVSHARDFAQTLPSIVALLPPDRRPDGPLSAGWVHGGMTSLQRDLALGRLRQPPSGGWSVVANARCLGEGVDVPEIDSVLFTSAKTSVPDIVQIAGRALRRHEEADTATLIVPTLIRSPGEDGGPSGETPYRHVLRVVSALAAHDGSLAAALGTARARCNPGDGEPPALPSQVTVLAAPGAVRAAIDALTLRVISGPVRTWDDGYQYAAAYAADHGDLDVPDGYACPDGFALSVWLSMQRASRKSGILSAARIGQLDAIGMIWDLDEHRWRARYREVAGFQRAHGHLRIPWSYRPPSKVGLAAWLARQLDSWRDGTLPPAYADLLTGLGLIRPEARDGKWDREFRALTEAVARHGGQKRLPSDSAEARWLGRERIKYQRGTLSGARAAKFREAGIALTLDDLWRFTLGFLTGFYAKNGHWAPPAQLRTPQGVLLDSWIRYQRAEGKAGTLKPERARLLAAAGFPLDAGTELLPRPGLMISGSDGVSLSGTRLIMFTARELAGRTICSNLRAGAWRM